MLNSWLHDNIISKLYVVIPPSSGSEMDRRTWCGSANGYFAISSASTLLCKFNDDSWDPTWLRIWSLKIPERVWSFIWLVHNDRWITSYHKSQTHIGEPWCHHCVDNVENVLHVLRDFPLAKSVWCNLIKIEARENFHVANLQEWIHMNLYQKLGKGWGW